MGKFKMPTVGQILEQKSPPSQTQPVWVYLEKEMRENSENKPYNEKVGAWLRYLKDLKHHVHSEDKKKEKRLHADVGPAWYCELSTPQREVLKDLKANMHQDLLEDLPNRIKKSLSDLGITTKIPKITLMKAMVDSIEDPGVFMWNIFEAVYKNPPSELRASYDMNAMIMMSSLVFIDIDECLESLEKLTKSEKTPRTKKKKEVKRNFQPDIQYGAYQQECYVPFYSTHSSDENDERKPPALDCKVKLKSPESMEKLCKDHRFLEKRKERNKHEQQAKRECDYTFWEPPCTLRNTDPKMAAYVNQLKMIKEKPKAKYKSLFENAQYHIGGVAFTGGHPQYILNNVVILPTGYIPINAGNVSIKGQNVTHIFGYWKYPKVVQEECDETCDCAMKWESAVMDYLKESKCKCGHLYDYYHEGKPKEIFFYPPSKHVPLYIDKAKVYQMDPMEDFIKDKIKNALLSVDVTPVPSKPAMSASGLKDEVILGSFLADLADTPLMIPHLPNANLLNNLKEWARKRVKGKLTTKQKKQQILQSHRKWCDLKHMKFRAPATRIQFTAEQLKGMNWSHRKIVQKLFENVQNDFVTSNRMKLVEQTQLLWATTKYDANPSKAFVDMFFTYMPGRLKDIFLINPYSSELTPKYGAKTCPL